ncbi:MAG: acyltransferase family protein [Promethearchaeota archaeon]
MLFAVPVFIFLSGFSLTIRYKESLDLRSFYKRRFRYLLPAYAIRVFLFYFLISYENLIFPNDTNNNVITPFHEFIISYFLILITGNVKTLWFLYVIFQYYLIYPFLLKFYKKLNSNLKREILILLFLFTFLTYFIGNQIFNIFFLEYENYIFLGDYTVNIAFTFFLFHFLFISLLGFVLVLIGNHL